MPIALALPVNRVSAQHRRCTQKDHHVSRRVVLSTCHSLVDRLAVVRAVRNEAGNLAGDLLEQTGNFVGVIGTILSQCVLHDFTSARVDRQMKLPPRSTAAAMSLFIPFALSEQLQPVLSTIRCLAPCEIALGRRSTKLPLRRLSVV